MDRYKSTKKASIFGIIGNIFLLIIKGAIGIISNSQAMIADSFNSAGDILTSVITYAGNKISSKPCDEDHNLGHGKAEYIYSMLISLVIIVMATSILKDSIKSLFFPQTYDFSIWLVIVCITTIITKFALFTYTNKLSKKLNNLLLKANAKDHINDCAITTLNLISCIFGIFGFYYLDGIVGIIISIWIGIQGLKVFIESYDVLMDKSISNQTKEEVFEIINKYDQIKKVTHFNSTPIGYMYQISFSIFIDGNLSTFESHEIADSLEKEIVNSIDSIYLTVIHVNPI